MNKSEQDELRALAFQRLHPRTYLERFLQEKVRPDGRGPDDWRDIAINVGGWFGFFPCLSWSRTNLAGSISTADGSALVRLGDTTVVCGVKAEIAEPDLESPQDGFLGMG